MNALPRANSERCQVFIVDDHPLVREWLGALIERAPDLKICGHADDASAALTAMPRAQPDVMIIDLSLPRGSGLELIKCMRERFSSVRLLVFSMHDDVGTAERALRAGAHGYLVKREPGARIIEGIRAVWAGKFFASPLLAVQLAGRLVSGAASLKGEPEDVLSDREIEVFRLRGEGLGTKEIAERLRVSAKTVASYDARIKVKLGFDSVVTLTRAGALWAERQRGL